MKKFKIADYIICTVLIIGFIAYYFFKIEKIYFTGCLVVGAWQILSMIVHAVNKCFINKNGPRFIYHCVILILIATLIVSVLFLDSGTTILNFLYYTAPTMAIFYTWLCYHEVTLKMRRPLALLK